MQFATESWNGRAIVKMKELVEYLELWLGETPTYQMKEPCATVWRLFMWAPETCCQIRPGARSLGEISIHSRRYMIHYVMGHLLWSKGGG